MKTKKLINSIILRFKRIFNFLNRNKKYKYIAVAILALLLFTLICSIFKNLSDDNLPENKELASLNYKIKSKVSGVSGSTSKESLSDLLKKRMEILKKEFIDNPRIVSKYSLDSTTKNKIPEALSTMVEENKVINGSIKVIDAYGENRESYIDYSLAYTDGGIEKSAKLLLADKEQTLESSDNAEVEGVYLDNYMLASPDSVNAQNEQSSSQAPASLLVDGVVEDKVLVIKATFQDKPLMSKSDSDDFDGNLRSTIFGATSDYFKTESYGKYRLKEVAITDWVILPFSADDDCTANWGKWDSYAKAHVNYNKPDYDSAIVQIHGQNTKCHATTRGDGTAITVAGYGGGDSSTYFGTYSWNVYAHEYGHNLGLNHSTSGYKCDESDKCTWKEYGNPYDIMGSGTGFSVVNKVKLGWIDSSHVADLSVPGKYEIYGASAKNLSDPNKIVLGKKMISLKNTGNSHDFVTSVGYNYLEYYSPGSMIMNYRQKYAGRGTISESGYNHLLDLNRAEDVYASEKGSDITGYKLISYDNEKTVIEVVAHGGTRTNLEVEKIKMTGSYPSTITAGVKWDFRRNAVASLKYATGSYYGLDYNWIGANSSGIFDKTTAGEYEVQAYSGTIKSDIIKITVKPAVFDQLILSPNADKEAIVGEDIKLSASLQDKYGNVADISTYSLKYEWKVSSGESLEGDGSSSQFKALSPGTYDVSVTASDAMDTSLTSKTTRIIVKPASIDHIVVMNGSEGDTKTIVAGEKLQFTAYAKDRLENVVPGAKYTWSGADANGNFTSNTTGTYQIKATSGNVESKAFTVNVVPGDLDHVNISPNTNSIISIGKSIQFTAQGQDKYNNNIPGLVYYWVGADKDGLFTAKKVGLFTINAASGPLSSERVTINVPTSTKITTPSSVNPGDATKSTNSLAEPILVSIIKNGIDIGTLADGIINLKNSDKINLFGTSLIGSTVVIYVDKEKQEVKTDTKGEWKIELPISNLSMGSHNISAKSQKDSISSNLIKIVDVEIIKSDKVDSSTTKGQTSDTKITPDKDKSVTTESEKADQGSFLTSPVFIVITSAITLIGVGAASFVILRRLFG